MKIRTLLFTTTYSILALTTIALVTLSIVSQSNAQADSASTRIAQSRAMETLFLSFNPRRFVPIEKAIEAAGGQVRFSEGRVGYIRASVPHGKLTYITHLPGVDAAETFDAAAVERYEAEAKSSVDTFQAKAEADARKHPHPPVPKPYFAAAEIGRNAWLQQHPTYDGRGTVIGISESAPDFLHPEFGPARDLQGRLIPKFLDVVPLGEAPDDGWLDVSQHVTTANRTLRWNGRRYRVPHPGTYSIVAFHKIKAYVVLWDARARTIRIRDSGDTDFTHTPAIGEYRTAHRFGRIRLTSNSPLAGYALHATKDGKNIYITVGAAPHPTMVSSTAAGDRRNSGLFDGVAPGAQIISYVAYTGDDDTSGKRYRMFEGVLRAGADPRVDVVSCSCGLALQPTNPYSAVVDHVLARFPSAFDKPFTYAGGIAPPGVITVAPYNSTEMFAWNLGIIGAPPSVPFLSTNNAGNLSPTVIEPEKSLAADSRVPSLALGWLDFVQAPKGYFIGGGSSNATPFAAGTIADLVSAAKQHGFPFNLEKILSALWTGSTWLSESKGSDQRERLPVLQPVWQALWKIHSIDVPKFVVSAPILRSGEKPVMGTGLLDETTSVGNSYERTVLVRQYGQTSDCCTVRVQGNDGSFRIQRVTHNDTVLRVSIVETPKVIGRHIAELDIIDKRTRAIFQIVPLSLRVPIVAGAHDATVQFHLQDSAEKSVYLRRFSAGPIHLTITNWSPAVTAELISAEGKLISLGGTSTVMNTDRATGVLVVTQRKGIRTVYDVTIPPDRALWSLVVANHAERAHFQKPGYVRASPPALVQLRVE